MKKKKTLSILLLFLIVILFLFINKDKWINVGADEMVDIDAESIQPVINENKVENVKNNFEFLEGSVVKTLTYSKEELDNIYYGHRSFKDFNKNLSFSIYDKTFLNKFTIKDILEGFYLSIDGDKYLSVEDLLKSDDTLELFKNNIYISTKPWENKDGFKNLWLGGKSSKEDVNIEMAYENNRWCYTTSKPRNVSEILGIEKNVITRDAIETIFNFGVPNEVIFLGNEEFSEKPLEDYFKINDSLNEKRIGLVYKFKNFIMIYICNEISLRDEEVKKVRLETCMFTSYEVYENHLDSIYPKTKNGKAILWTKR